MAFTIEHDEKNNTIYFLAITEGGGSLLIYCRIPMLRPQGSLLMVCFS